MTNEIGILLTNVGSPDYPTSSAVQRYLKKFLSDKRVVTIPRLLWWPILYGFILQHRSHRSAELYQKIWTSTGSPLLYFSKKIASDLQAELQLPVELGTHYGNPSIASSLERLRSLKIKKILILPLYPQYSATTTAVTFDQVAEVLQAWRDLPELRFIHDYAKDENYIHAVSSSIQEHFLQHGTPKYLLFSFHSLPKDHVAKGDPYQNLCVTTAELVAEQLKLKKGEWSVAFQSRLGRAEWLAPYTDKVLQSLPKQGIQDVSVVCPGFPADCLETLEEIAIRGKKQFLEAGGKVFHYIPALNNQPQHIEALKKIILRHIQNW